MNRKTVLLLMNGFSFVTKKSDSFYDTSFMPTFEDLSKKYLFSRIRSNANNYYDAYRNISLDVSELYNYTLIDKEIENKKYVTNQTLINLKKDVVEKNGNLHIFCLVDTSLKMVNHLKETVKFINSEKINKIYIHLVMSSNSITDYNDLMTVFSKINMVLGEIAPICFIIGLSSIDNNAKQVDLNFFFKMFITKVGERWQSFTQKFDVLYGTKSLPRDTKPFMVNINFELTNNDTFLFFNYDNLNLSSFIDTLSGISFGNTPNNFSYYSLFKITSNKNVLNMYESRASEYSVINNLKKINSSGVMFCNPKRINVINYFINGLKNDNPDNFKYMDINVYLNNPNLLVSTINSLKDDLIIINIDLDEFTKLSEFKERFLQIDNILKSLHDNMIGSKYTIVVSSLYGVTKTIINDYGRNCPIISNQMVPFMFIDDFITRKGYLISNGTINDILKSCYKNIKKDSNFETIVEKQNALYRLFFK